MPVVGPVRPRRLTTGLGSAHPRYPTRGNPVPDPRYPFLGIHFTRRGDGGVDIGPNAVLALAREGYNWRQLTFADVWEIIAWTGLRRMARHHWRAGGRELATSLSKHFFVSAARRHIPSLRAEDVVRGPTGVRAEAVAGDGNLVDDFAVHFLGSIAAVRNAPSPATTSSLAIAQHLVDAWQRTLRPNLLEWRSTPPRYHS